MKTVRVRYKKNSHQGQFQADTLSKFLHLSSGFGGGKTYAVIMKAFQLSALNRGIPGGMVVPSIAEYKKDVLPMIEEILDDNHIKYRYHRTDKWFQFPWSKGRMYVATAERKIRGPNWGWAVINEATLISLTRFREVAGRVRIKRTPYPQIASSGTPEGIAHWAYETFVEKPWPRSRIIYGDTRNNLENLNDDYIATLEGSYDQVMLDAYLRGLFVNMNSNRFYYSYDPGKHHDELIYRDHAQEIHVSLDYNVSPMCATLWHIVPVTDGMGFPIKDTYGQPMLQLKGFDQIEIEDDADTHKMCDALFARGCSPDTTTIYPDPAGKQRSTKGPPDNEILKSRGFYKIRVRLVAPRFRERQLNVNNLLDKGLIKFNPNKCPGIKRDLAAVEQDKITLEKLKNNAKLTHYSDGLDYMCDILFPLSGKKPDSKMVRIR